MSPAQPSPPHRPAPEAAEPVPRAPRWAERVKRPVDLAAALMLLPLVAVLVPLVLLANLRANPGPLFFRQTRMGRGCRPFTLWKFRSMVPANVTLRGFDDPVEMDRITPFGAWLRRTRADELPQIINVLRGEMSIVGPRPDTYEHARAYCELIPGYRERHAVRPGITGLAQTRFGYAEGVHATRRKVRADLAYIRNIGVGLEIHILYCTVLTLVAGFGIARPRPLRHAVPRESEAELPIGAPSLR